MVYNGASIVGPQQFKLLFQYFNQNVIAIVCSVRWNSKKKPLHLSWPNVVRMLDLTAEFGK